MNWLMKVEVKILPKSTIELKVSVPNEKVKQTYDKLFNEVVKNTEMPGFRKGQAPAEMVKEKVDVSKLYGEVINNLLQTHYPQALKENHIHPISNPHVEITEFDLEKDFEFIATVAVKPEIKVGDYNAEVKKVHEEKTKELRKQNEERLKRGEKLEHDNAHLTADDVINAITKVTDVEIADIIKDDEIDRMMSRLVDQAQSVGLSLEQYLKAQNKTSEQLRYEYGQVAERNLKAELALSHLIEVEKIEVTDEEVSEMIDASGDEQLRESMRDPRQIMYIKSVLEKNKLINKIAKDIEGEHSHNEQKEDVADESGKVESKKED